MLAQNPYSQALGGEAVPSQIHRAEDARLGLRQAPPGRGQQG